MTELAYSLIALAIGVYLGRRYAMHGQRRLLSQLVALRQELTREKEK